MNKDKIVVGITHGDLAGISYEVIIKALSDARIFDLCTIVIYGSKVAAEYSKKRLAEVENFSFHYIDSPEAANPKKANLIVCGDENFKMELGASSAVGGKYAVTALQRALEDIKQDKIDVLVTCPLNKHNVNDVGFEFVGHTEFLAAAFSAAEPLMFMVSDPLKVGLVTMHIPIDRVAQSINAENILSHLRLIERSMIRDFGVPSPKIAVLGLNPHASDNGLLGDQEQNIIIPAIEVAKSERILAFGPFAADGFFGSGTYAKFDAVLAMYHDQGLAPFKAISFTQGVNFTAGLDIVRTSPAHGVGYDIAGQGVADPAPLRAAIYTALDIFRNRKNYDLISANPLQSNSRNNPPSRDRDANVEDIAGIGENFNS